MTHLRILSALACGLGAAASVAQESGPPPAASAAGMGVSAVSSLGQATRFSSEFNPAISFIVDAGLEAVDAERGRDGFDAELRAFELGANAWVDPNAWAYFNAAVEDESLALEEAAIHYTGLGGRNTLRAGRFFIDFGKQMQSHVHELRTTARPLALRTFLGDEVKGNGLQWDAWTPAGDSTVVRWSLAGFASAVAEESDGFDPAATPTLETLSPRHAEDFTFTARLTGFADAGERGTLQLGASLRALPRYSLTYEPGGALVGDDFDNTVVGLDATYGWVGDSGLQSWSAGLELLASVGDVGARVIDPDATPASGDESFDVLDGERWGGFAWADYAWDAFHSAGAVYGAVELPGARGADARELELYYTRKFSEYQRLRLALAWTDSDLDGESVRAVLQYTAVLGAHGHGANW